MHCVHNSCIKCTTAFEPSSFISPSKRLISFVVATFRQRFFDVNSESPLRIVWTVSVFVWYSLISVYMKNQVTIKWALTISEMSDFNENEKKKDKRGILRLDISKPRNSAGSVEFRNQPELIGQVRSICRRGKADSLQNERRVWDRSQAFRAFRRPDWMLLFASSFIYQPLTLNYRSWKMWLNVTKLIWIVNINGGDTLATPNSNGTTSVMILSAMISLKCVRSAS